MASTAVASTQHSLITPAMTMRAARVMSALKLGLPNDEQVDFEYMG